MLFEDRYVEVAFPMPLNQTFTYRWQFDHAFSPVGYRVLVPFQKRLLTGYVIEQTTTSIETPIKDVQDILDEMPVLTSELIELIHHIRQKYGTSLGEALQTVIPAGLIKQTKKTIFVETKEGCPQDFEERKLLEVFQKKKATDWNTWAKKNPQTLPALRRLQKNGWIRVDSILQNQKAKNLIETFFYPKESGQNQSVKGKKQLQILETVNARQKISLTELKEIFGATSGTTLKLLEKKDLIYKKLEEFREAESTDPLSQALKLTKEQKAIVDRVTDAGENESKF